MKTNYPDSAYDILPARKLCPHCETEKPIRHFGLRTLKGVVVAQSWCRKCRREAVKAQ